MALYRVQLRGENFLLNLTGDPELLGFTVTHYVVAEDEAQAAKIGLILVRKSQHLQTTQMNTQENPNRLRVEAVKRVWWRRRRCDGRYRFWHMDEPVATES